MPEPTPPPDAGGIAGRRQGPLTPDAIDAILADFRRWLEDLAAGAPEPPPEPEGPAVDLATLVGAFTALRHEVNLQTRATRAQSEQFAQALQAVSGPAAGPGEDDGAQPLVKALVEVYDTLTRTTTEIDRLHQGVRELQDGTSNADDSPASKEAEPVLSPRRPSFLGRLFGGLAARQHWEWEQRFFSLLRSEEQRRSVKVAAAAERLEATATGLRMSQRRVERLMREAGLEPVECVGRPFDLEAMEAVEAVADSGKPAGTVIEELRRGYRWRGRVFRYAQVRVAQ